MVGSAPWVESQFRKKGIDTLLDVAADLPQLRLAFLWRGVLFEEMSRRVRQRGLEARVDVLNREVDVNRVLGGVHASIALAEDPTIIKAFPHSLMESLAAGKPVLISRGIPLAEVVERTGCGQVVDRITPRAIADALYKLGQDYDASCQSALRVGRSHFSHDRMVADYVDVYRNALDGG